MILLAWGPNLAEYMSGRKDTLQRSDTIIRGRRVRLRRLLAWRKCRRATGDNRPPPQAIWDGQRTSATPISH